MKKLEASVFVHTEIIGECPYTIEVHGQGHAVLCIPEAWSGPSNSVLRIQMLDGHQEPLTRLSTIGLEHMAEAQGEVEEGRVWIIPIGGEVFHLAIAGGQTSSEPEESVRIPLTSREVARLLAELGRLRGP